MIQETIKNDNSIIKEEKQLKAFHVICYIDNEEIAQALADLQPNEWAFITHNRDYDEYGRAVSIHKHVYLKFENKVSASKIAKAFNVNIKLLAPVQSRTGLLRYFIHSGKLDKALYSINEITTNINELNYIIDGKEKASESVYELIKKFIFNDGIMSRAKIVDGLYKAGYGSYMASKFYYINKLMDIFLGMERGK